MVSFSVSFFIVFTMSGKLAAAEERIDRAQERHDVTIRIVGYHENSPEGTLVVSVDVGGIVRDIDGREISGKDFSRLCVEKKKEAYYIKLVVKDEKKTSVAILTETVSMIRESLPKDCTFIVLVALGDPKVDKGKQK
jgi:hypothetical protein